MSEVLKDFSANIDLKETLVFEPIKVVEGDNGNVLALNIVKDGDPVDLTDCLVQIVFAHSGRTVWQDSSSPDGGITIGGTDHNEVTVRLHSDSFAPNGITVCQVKIYSGDGQETLVSSSRFSFKAELSLLNAETVESIEQYSILVTLIQSVNSVLDDHQPDWDETNVLLKPYIKNKPVVGTDIQAATQGLTAATAVIANTASIPVHDTTHKRITWQQVKTWLQNLFDTVYAPLSHKSRHATGGADQLTAGDIGAASLVHAARHKKGGADVLTPNDIGAAGIDANGKTLADQSSSKIVTLTDDTPVLLLEHAGCFIRISGSVNKTVTIPPNASLSFPIGTEIVIVDWLSSGRITIAPGSGVQIFWSDGTGGSKVSTNGAATFALKYIESNIWIGNRL